MVSERLQHQRYELKYHVAEAKALRIRDFVQGYLEVDEYSALQTGLSYPTLSLYLDSDGLDTHWHTINGNRNRFKLRLRYYDDQPDTPVFFETKRRENNAFDCVQMGAAKYSEGIVTRGEDWVQRACSSEALVGEFLSAENYPGLLEAGSAKV
jgi:VTC domain